jgi:hypothetical protein
MEDSFRLLVHDLYPGAGLSFGNASMYFDVAATGHSCLFVWFNAVDSRVASSIYSRLVLHTLSLGPLLQLEAFGNDEILNGHRHICFFISDAKAVVHLITFLS